MWLLRLEMEEVGDWAASMRRSLRLAIDGVMLLMFASFGVTTTLETGHWFLLLIYGLGGLLGSLCLGLAAWRFYRG